jgi:hypothetical protein
MFKRTLLGRLISFLNPSVVDDSGGGGGGGPTITPEVQALIDSAVSGLKAKNGELIGKLKDATTNLQRFDGIDPDAVRTILSKFASDEEAALIAKGDIDTVLSKRTERMQADFAKKEKGWTDADARKDAKIKKLESGKVSGALTAAASKAGALPEAMEDIVLRGQSTWRVNDDGDVVAMNGDEVVLGKDGKTPLTPIEWAESLREAAPHLWPKAQGTGAPGSSTQPRSGSEIFKLSPVERMNAARAQRK